ncbi:MAG TPA: hypothetical protein VLA43_01780 [Longimicrobiales bacterium]|nr:hypothetical protein [Longimicrobiales bacterium]
MFRLRPIALLVLALPAAACDPGGAPWPDGVRVDQEPIQGRPRGQPFAVGEFQVTPVASFDVEARVLGRQRYRGGVESKLSPWDLFLGWGEMSDERIVGTMEFVQMNRWGSWRSDATDLPPVTELLDQSSNMHVIPADDTVRRLLAEIRAGDRVRLVGQLVDVDRDDGWRWRTSRTRTDRGDGACELVYVTRVEWLPAGQE